MKLLKWIAVFFCTVIILITILGACMKIYFGEEFPEWTALFALPVAVLSLVVATLFEKTFD